MNLKKQLQTLKNLGFKETRPLTYVLLDVNRGNLFVQYDVNTLERKSWATTLSGDPMKKEDWEEYTLFKLQEKRYR